VNADLRPLLLAKKDWAPPWPLKDKDWARLAKIVELPDVARDDLASVLGLGRSLVKIEPTLTPPNVTKKNLAKTRGYAERLLNDLYLIVDMRRPGAKGEVLMALISPPDDTERPEGFHPPAHMSAYQILMKHVECVSSLAKWLALAEQRLPAAKTGDKNFGAYTVTGNIDVLLKRHRGGRGLARDKKDDRGEEFLEACFKIIGVDAKVKAASMIERLVRDRGKVSTKKT
jgi:hypothetical protein